MYWSWLDCYIDARNLLYLGSGCFVGSSGDMVWAFLRSIEVWNQFDCGASMTQQLPYSLTTSSSPIYACCIQGGAPSVVDLEYSL